MENTEELISQADQVGPRYDSDSKLDHPEACTSFTRSDSGKGKSLTSQDLVDLDNDIHNVCATDALSEDNIFMVEDMVKLQNGSVGCDNAALVGDIGSVLHKNTPPNSTPSSSALHRSLKKIERQHSFDSSLDPRALLLLSSELNPLSIERDGPITRPELKSCVIGSPERSVECTNDYDVNNVPASNDGTGSAVQELPYYPQPILSSHNAKLELIDNSNATSSATANAGHDNIQRCMSAPTSSSTTCHLCGFSSLPVSYSGMVSKEIMNHMARELSRERFKVATLQQVNDQLRKSISDLETTNKDIVHTATSRLNQLQTQCKEQIPYLQRQSAIWRQKFQEKEQELSTKLQEIETLHTKFNELTLETNCQLNSLNQKVLAERMEKEDVRKVLKSNRARFNRDEKELRKKVEDWKQAYQWVMEGKTEGDGYNLQSSPHLLNGSNETELKGVISENAAELNYGTHQNQGARPNEGQTMSKGVKNNEDLQEKCFHCYRRCSEFSSYEMFKEHIGRCEY